MTWVSDYQRWLSEDESLQNAQTVVDYFKGKGWTKNALSAMLGNMRHESSINPDMYEYGYSWESDRGYGLVQWTPRSKYWDWAVSNGLSPRLGDSQLARIQFEVDSNIQWIQTSSYPLSFAQFRNSTQSVSYLTEAFTWNYERPNATAGQESMPERKAFAQRCFNELNWNGEGGGSGQQLAQFPMDMIHVTQGENGSYSHLGTLAMDFIGTTIQYPYYAPCDVKLLRRIDSSAVMVWGSVNPVMCADGMVRSIVFDVIHDDNLLYSEGDVVNKGQLLGRTGVSGNVTGDHLHLQVIEGTTYNGFGTTPQGHSTLIGNQLHIYDVFAVNGVRIVQGMGYDWKTSDYDENTQPPTGVSTRYIEMLLCDALNGWR